MVARKSSVVIETASEDDGTGPVPASLLPPPPPPRPNRSRADATIAVAESERDISDSLRTQPPAGTAEEQAPTYKNAVEEDNVLHDSGPSSPNVFLVQREEANYLHHHLLPPQRQSVGSPSRSPPLPPPPPRNMDGSSSSFTDGSLSTVNASSGLLRLIPPAVTTMMAPTMTTAPLLEEGTYRSWGTAVAGNGGQEAAPAVVATESPDDDGSFLGEPREGTAPLEQRRIEPAIDDGIVSKPLEASPDQQVDGWSIGHTTGKDASDHSNGWHPPPTEAESRYVNGQPISGRPAGSQFSAATQRQAPPIKSFHPPPAVRHSPPATARSAAVPDHNHPADPRLRRAQPFPPPNRPPTADHHSRSSLATPARGNSSPPAVAATWRNVWSKIERGLDGLAQLGDVVTERAQHLYSATVSTVVHGAAAAVRTRETTSARVRPPRGPGRTIPPSRGAQEVSTTRQYAEHRVKDDEEDLQFHLSRFEKKHLASAPAKSLAEKKVGGVDDVATSTVRDSASPNLYSVLYRKSTTPPDGAPTDAGHDSPQGDLLMPRTRDLLTGQQTRKLIRANGGASLPQDVENQSGYPADPSEPLSNGPPMDNRGLGPPRNPHSIPPGVVPPTAPQQPRRNPMASVRESWESQHLPHASSGGSAAAAQRRSYSDDYDDDDGFMAKIGRLLPPIPRLRSLSLNPFWNRGMYNDYSAATLDAWNADDDQQSTKLTGILGLFRSKPKASEQLPSTQAAIRKDDQYLTPALADLMDRCESGKSLSLLTRQDIGTCRSIGRTLAVFDVVNLLSVLVIARQVSVQGLDFPQRLDELVTYTLPTLLRGSLQSWAPFAVAAAVLATKSSDLVRSLRLEPQLRNLERSIRDEAQYASLFLRVVSSSPLPKETPTLVASVARKQVMNKVESSRLRLLIGSLVSSLVLMTVSVVEPIFVAVMQFIAQLVNMQQWYHLPMSWSSILVDANRAVSTLSGTVNEVIRNELRDVLDHPVKVFYQATVFFALIAASWFPRIEALRTVEQTRNTDDDDEAAEVHARYTEHVSDLGSSSASRLDLLANGRAVESVLERWKAMLPARQERKTGLSSTALLRVLFYNIVSGAILALPLTAFRYTGSATFASSSMPQLRWDSFLDVSVVLLFSHFVLGRALTACVLSKEAECAISGFVSSLAGVAEGRRKLMQEQPLNLQLQASISPMSGVLVKDLWAAHTTRRAWAVRGANLSCRNGEILLLLGDAGSGKSRLLTTLAESVTAPPPRAQTVSKVRGSITFGSLEVNKWDKNQLSRRLGLFLSDVRTVADVSKVLSGLTIEEILEPSSGTRSFVDPAHHPGSHERMAMMIALKLTGLHSSLLPRLPSKLSTVVTGSEEDLRPSSLRPRHNILSSVEWSKLLLTRVLTQAICDNENAASSHDKVEQCLVGSYLILDDVTAYFSEVDEARLMIDLRSTGAAVIMSSNRWATGRFADRIAVLKDGAIVESGTHNELLNRGPQQSIYAARWHAMTSQ